MKLRDEGLSRYSNKIESVALRKCPCYHSPTLVVLIIELTYFTGYTNRTCEKYCAAGVAMETAEHVGAAASGGPAGRVFETAKTGADQRR